MEAVSLIVPGQFGYLSLSSRELREFVDGLFVQFAKFPIADSQAVGWGHRYRAGHDLFLDVPRTTFEYGIADGYKHAGHIVLTDFPTKAGIPIPGFSQSGLGEWVEGLGISRGWLNVNICDTGVGIIAISEGSEDLKSALNGSLSMDSSVFFDTFVEGGVEIVLSTYTQNPILAVGGIENILAGLVSTWDTFSVHVDPLFFFGGTFTSALVGFSIGVGVANQSLPEALVSGIKSSAVGALFVISPAFGFAAISGLLCFSAGRILAARHQEMKEFFFKIDRNSINLFVETVEGGSPNFSEFLKLADKELIQITIIDFDDSPTRTLDTSVRSLGYDQSTLSDLYRTFDYRFPSTSQIEDSNRARMPNSLQLRVRKFDDSFDF